MSDLIIPSSNEGFQRMVENAFRDELNVEGTLALSQFLFSRPPKQKSEINDSQVIERELDEDFKQKLNQYDVYTIAMALSHLTLFGKNLCFSPLYNFSRTPEGCTILLKLLDFRPAVASHLHTISLYNMVEHKDGMHYSALFWLSYYAKGREVLTRLFQNNLNYIGQISPYALFVRNYHGKYANLSAFDLLAGTPDGRELLWQIIANNSLVRQKIDGTFLYRQWVYGVHEGTSPFYWLCSSRTGIKILNRLFMERPELRDIDKAVLYGKKDNFPYRNSSPDKLLQQSEEGKALRSLIKEQEGGVHNALSNLGDVLAHESSRSIGMISGSLAFMFFRGIKFPRCSHNMGFFVGKAAGVGENVADLAGVMDQGVKASAFSLHDGAVVVFSLLLVVGCCSLVSAVINKCSKELEIDPEPVCSPLSQS